MRSLALLLTPLVAPLVALGNAPSPLTNAARLVASAGPIRSLCLPPDDSATTPRREIGSASYQTPPGFAIVTNAGDEHVFQNLSRYVGITDRGDREYLAKSDFTGRVSCSTVVNGRPVTVTMVKTELEHSQRLTAPGVIGMQNVAVAEWDQPVDGHLLMAFAIARNPEDLEVFRTMLYSIRVKGDSVHPTMTLAELLPHWAAVRVDTIAGLELETQAMAGRTRFVARSVGGDVAVTSPELAPDDVRAWSDAVELLARAPSAGIRALGSSVAATATNVGGKPAVAVSFAEETSDAQVALALTPADATRLAGALRAAMNVVAPRTH